MSNLESTRSTFKLRGQIVGTLSDKYYTEGIGKESGKHWKKLQFGVKTSPTNIVYVEFMGSEKDEIKIKSPENKEETLTLAWDKRNDLPPKHYISDIGRFSIAVAKDASGKYIRETVMAYDAVDLIREHVQEGDTVYVSGSIEFGTYESNGEVKNQVKYIVKSFGLNEPIDFESDKFVEMSSFESEIIPIHLEVDKKSKKVYVNAYSIDWKKDFHPANFVIDGNTHEKLATEFYKRIKPYDFVKVVGKIINAVEVVEAEWEEDPFGSEMPAGFSNSGTVKNIIKELRITGVARDKEGKSVHVPKKYKEDDFVKDFSFEDPFGDDSPLVFDEDDLPF